MKKIVFWILSLLLITPVFAVDYSPSWTYNTAISFESLTQNNNITYYLYNYWWNWSYFWYLTNWFSIGQLFPKYLSLEQSWYWYYINSDYVWNIFKFWSLNNSNSFLQYYSLLAFTLSWWLPKLWYNSLYLQSTSSSTTNKLVAFWNNEIDYNNSVSLSNSYVRYFYNTWLLFTWITPNYSDFYSNPVGVQIFGSALYTLTNRWKIYDYAWVSSIHKNWVLSSYFDWYSYILWSWENLSFYSVLPWITQFVSWSYVVPNYFQTDNFLMFRWDWNKYNWDYSVVWVLSFSWSNLLYSKYSCNWLSLTLDDDWKYSYNFDSACSLLDWWILNSWWRIYNTRCWYFDIKDFFSRFKTSWNWCNPDNYYWNYLSLSFDSNNNLVLSSLSEMNLSNNSVSRYHISLPLTSVYWVDILRWFDNNAVPPDPLTTWKVENLLDIYCNQLHLINPAICNNWGPVIWSWAYTYEPIVSWDQVILVITDYSDTNDYVIHTWEDWEIWLECVWDWCPIYNNTWSTQIWDIWWSWFILSTWYYEDFFNKTGYFGKCPYPYTDIQFWEKIKIFNKISDALWGFDIFLPINCSIAAFQAWKTFSFLSDVSLWLNPLMWQIQGPDDPRVYLYRFFDFLFSFALIIFLLKIYHLLN